MTTHPTTKSFNILHLKSILAMHRPPAEEARYLENLYQEETIAIVEDCILLFKSMNDTTATTYWQQVRNYIGQQTPVKGN